MKMQIKSRHDDSVLFEIDAPSIKAAVESAVASGANLSGANLSGAYLYGANLDGAYLDGAYLSGADLSGANLSGAYLSGADLYGANLSGANLSGANLSGAYLYGANLDGKRKLVGPRPVLQIGPIGSRCAYLYAYLTDGGVYVRAGCWFGTVDRFAERVTAAHGGNEHGQEYCAAIAMIRAHAAIWTPKVEGK